jgi:predicted RNA-binding protein with TRAM domain
MTKKCPTCGGDGIVISEGTAALDVERRLRALATGSRAQAYRVEVAAPVASLLIGSGAERLVELEAQTRRRFYLVGKEGLHLDHFVVLEEGKRDDLAVKAPVAEGAEVRLELGEVALHDVNAGVGKVEGFDVCVANAAGLVGKKVKVRIERILDGVEYATLLEPAVPVESPITAEREAEKPTRAKKPTVAEETVGEESKPKKKTRRGSRGGRGRKKKTTPTTVAAVAADNGAGEPEQIEKPVAKIHVPDRDLGQPGAEAEEDVPAETAEAAPKAKKKTRRGTRGGRNRKRKTTVSTAVGEEPSQEWSYVPMSEWGDDLSEE